MAGSILCTEYIAWKGNKPYASKLINNKFATKDFCQVLHSQVNAIIRNEQDALIIYSGKQCLILDTVTKECLSEMIRLG